MLSRLSLPARLLNQVRSTSRLSAVATFSAASLVKHADGNTVQELSIPNEQLTTVPKPITSTEGLVGAISKYASAIPPGELTDDSFPSFFSSDVVSLLPSTNPAVPGKRALMADDVKFEFSCTGCGACCRGFADTVLVDPWDLKRMNAVRFPPEVGTSSGGASSSPSKESILVTRSDSFTVSLGMFTARSLATTLPAPVPTTDATAPGVASQPSTTPSSRLPSIPDWDIPPVYVESGMVSSRVENNDNEWADRTARTFGLASTKLLESEAWGYAPVVFLRSKPVETRGRRGETTSRVRKLKKVADASVSLRGPVIINDDEDRVCSFAVSHTKPSGQPGLRCSLGSQGMPGACSLYPMGELWTHNTGTAAQPVYTEFYTLDASRCEGVSNVEERREEGRRGQEGSSNEHMTGKDTGSTTGSRVSTSRSGMTARQYRTDPSRDLGARKEFHDWFKHLVTATVVHQLDQRLAQAYQSMCDVLVDAITQSQFETEVLNLSSPLSWKEIFISGTPPPIPASLKIILQTTLPCLVPFTAGTGREDDIARVIHDFLYTTWYMHPVLLQQHTSMQEVQTALQHDTVELQTYLQAVLGHIGGLGAAGRLTITRRRAAWTPVQHTQWRAYLKTLRHNKDTLSSKVLDRFLHRRKKSDSSPLSSPLSSPITTARTHASYVFVTQLLQVQAESCAPHT